jgi:lipopolysaccharide export system protein LptA
MYKIFLTLITFFVFSSFSFAQNAPSKETGLKLSNDMPVQIESDSLDVKDDEKTAQFSGNVRVVQGDMQLSAQKMTVFYLETNAAQNPNAAALDRLIIEGDVRATSGTQSAAGDVATIDMKTKTLVMTGKSVTLSDKGNVIKGCKLTVQMENGTAKFSQCRVKVTVDPKSKS